ncbi:hypothetical protein EPN52_00895 [bacterium]|nr:MAG: hypothetical protein EPN52_00895 [bacterium]
MSALRITIRGKSHIVGEIYDDRLPLCDYCHTQQIPFDRLFVALAARRRDTERYYCSQACAKNAATKRYRERKRSAK